MDSEIADLFLGKLAEGLDKFLESKKQEEAKSRLLTNFPIGSQGAGILDERIFNELTHKLVFNELTHKLGQGAPSSHSMHIFRCLSGKDVPSDAFSINVVNKTSGIYEEVFVQLSLPEIDLPPLNFPPYRASQIKPIRNLISGYFLPYDFEQPNGEAFARNVAASFSGKTLQFEVTGAVNGACLIVSCKKINDAIKRKRRKFCTELDAIKKSFAKGIKQKDIDLHPWRPESPLAIKEKPRKGKPRSFKIQDDLEPSSRSHTRGAHTPKSDVLEGKPVLIDGNNVVLHNTKHGWRVLKTLVDWFKRNGVDYFIFFDATIEYKGIDAEGMAFIESEKVSEHAKKCPSRDEADNFILNRANNTGSHVISDDGYKQWDARYPWINTRNNTGDIRRIHKFLAEGNYLSVPDLGIWERIFGT